jgi:hypothetical protein
MIGKEAAFFYRKRRQTLKSFKTREHGEGGGSEALAISHPCICLSSATLNPTSAIGKNTTGSPKIVDPTPQQTLSSTPRHMFALSPLREGPDSNG